MCQTQQYHVRKQYYIMLAGLHVLTLNHHQALKAQIHIVNELCIILQDGTSNLRGSCRVKDDSSIF
jgi:hypothetical protein